MRDPDGYIALLREYEVAGEPTTEPHLGLFWPVEKVAEVGVPKSLGDGCRKGKWLEPALRYESMEFMESRWA